MTQPKTEISTAIQKFIDLLVVKKLIVTTLKTAADSETINTQTINKIKPGAACFSEKPFKPSNKRKNKTTPKPTFAKTVIAKGINFIV